MKFPLRVDTTIYSRPFYGMLLRACQNNEVPQVQSVECGAIRQRHLACLQLAKYEGKGRGGVDKNHHPPIPGKCVLVLHVPARQTYIF